MEQMRTLRHSDLPKIIADNECQDLNLQFDPKALFATTALYHFTPILCFILDLLTPMDRSLKN